MEEKYHYSLDNFLRLCRKAQELIFDSLKEHKTSYFFEIDDIYDETLSLTPIEQIFQIGNQLRSVYEKISIDFETQKEIIVNGKKYRVDFYIEQELDYKEINGKFQELLYKFDKPLIIELDGREYHSNKNQMNYDYERENELKLAGYDIIRFTGSQVYNDVYGCLDKVRQFLDSTPKKLVVKEPLNDNIFEEV